MVLSLISTRDVLAAEQSDVGAFASKLPNFSLKDPVGKMFTSKDLSRDGLVLVVTAPILKAESAQKGWDQHLMKAKAGSKAKLVFLEDMQPSLFKGKAMNGMKKEYKPGKEPILLIDHSGNIRRALKVSAKSTVVLVYSQSGELVYSRIDKPSAQAAQMIWARVKK